MYFAQSVWNENTIVEFRLYAHIFNFWKQSKLLKKVCMWVYV